MEETRTPEQWLERFYAETDPVKRGKCLEKLIASGYDAESCQKLRQLWDLRYKKSRQEVADVFLREWMDLYYVSNKKDGLFGAKSNRKLIQKALNTLCLSGEGRFPEEMLYSEMKNLACFYITISLCDKPSILGFPIRTKQDTIKRRVKETVLKVTSELPQKYGLEKEFSVLTCAAEEALSECMDNDEE